MSETLRLKVASAWHKAATELGLKFTSPYSVETLNGERIQCLGLIHSFGRPFGTLIEVVSEEPSPLRAKTFGDEYSVSELTDIYAVYNRNLFVETLDDWGWFGVPEKRPSWYSGKPWS